MFPHWWRMFYLHWPQSICTCETNSHREMFDLSTCSFCPSASGEGWMYTLLKNQTFELMLSLNVEAIHLLQQFRAVFVLNPNFHLYLSKGFSCRKCCFLLISLGVHGFRNGSVTTCSAWTQTKLFLSDLQVITLIDHNDVISCFVCWYKHIFLLEFS